MLATVINGPGLIDVVEVPDPKIIDQTDAVVRVVAACVCGSDLWRYRGLSPVTAGSRIGHEFVGVVTEVGSEVTSVAEGDFVIAPFYNCDMTCPNCKFGYSSACQHLGWWGSEDSNGHFADAGQGEQVRVPHADGTLVATPQVPDADLVPSLLTLSDVFLTGYHAAVSAGVGPGTTVAVSGDGAVGLSAILASRVLGATRIVAMSRHEYRAALATDFGATDVVPQRGEDGIAAVREMFSGVGPDCALECVGTEQAMAQALGSVRAGGRVGFVGVPNADPTISTRQLFNTNVGVKGGVAPVRNYVEQILPMVWDRTITPGKVFTKTLPLTEAAEAYRLMDQREAIKVMLAM